MNFEIEITRRSVLIMLAFTSILVLLVNIGAWAYLRAHPVNRAVSRVGQKWQLIERMEEPVDWVVLGDSSCGQGIRPDVLAEILGGTAVNLCTVANATVINDAWLLQRYIELHGPPRGVILFHVFHAWERDTDDLVKLFDQIPLPGRFWRDYNPPISLPIHREIGFLIKPMTTLWNSNLSMRHMMHMWGNILTGRGKLDDAFSEAENDLAFVIRHGGFVEERTPRPEKVQRDTDAHIQKYGQASFTITTENRNALRAIIRMADQNNFRLYVSNSSITAGLYADTGIRRYFGEMLKVLEAESEGSQHVTFVLRDPPQYLPQQMDNVDHVVGADVAADLTQKLAVAIQEADAKK